MHLIKIETEADLLITFQDDRVIAANAADFEHEIGDMVVHQNKNIILNLDKIAFVDGSGLGALISVRKMLSDKRTMTLCAVSEQVMEVLTLAKLGPFFDIQPNVAMSQKTHH